MQSIQVCMAYIRHLSSYTEASNIVPVLLSKIGFLVQSMIHLVHDMRQSKPHLPHGPLIYIQVLLALCKSIAGRIHTVNTALRGLFKEAYRRVPCGMRVLYLRTAFACLPEKLRYTACNGLIRPGPVATRMINP